MRNSSVITQSALVFLAVAASVSGCKCDSRGLGTTYGEIQVIWRDANNERVLNRDGTYDFGTALVGERKPMVMTLRNGGSARLKLAKLELVDGDEVLFGQPLLLVPTSNTNSFEAEFDSVEILPLQEKEFAIRFTPRGMKSEYLSHLKLTVEGTRVEDSTANITFIGKGEKGSCEIPSVIDFGKTPVGETLPYAVHLTNTTTVAATGNAGPISGANASSFGYGATSPTGAVSVGPMSTVDVIVTFSPTEMRQYEAQVVLRGAGECPEKTVILRGEGSNETLSWSPSTLNYGFVNPGTETVKEVVFINPASVPITLTAVTSTNSADFYHVVPAGQDATKFTVPGGKVPTAMKVACNPSMLGPRPTGTLTFLTGLNRAGSGSGAITLHCTGGGPRIRVTPRPTLAFGRVGYFPGNTTFSVQRKINVQNVGTRPPMPDLTANLFLGQIAMDGTPGQIPLMDITPGAGTSPGEFSVALGSTYNPATGLVAVAGLNFVDVTVTLKPQSVGMKEATFTLYSNDATEPTITVSVTADVQTPPPCSFVTSPPVANFGLVTPGTQKDLPITITNNSVVAGEVCYLSGIELGAGSDLAYSIVGGNIVEKELQPQESFQVVVRAAPTGSTPTTLQTLNGQLVFNSTSAVRPQASIPLQASVGPSCLTVTPDPMDFGTVKVGCSSPPRSFNIYNTCSTPITISTFTLQAAAGQPPGGPNCPGANACPEFRMVSAPSIPTGGLTLNPGGSAPVTFQARYSPIDVGSDSGAVAIGAIQNGQSITYLVGLLGRGDTTGLQVDTHTQDLQPKADILLVIDDSCSMEDKQIALASNFTSFIQYAVAANVDYQIGVTTTTESLNECFPNPFGPPTCLPNNSKGPGGKLVRDTATGLKFVKPTTPSVASVFSRLVNVGTTGSATEVALSTAVLALTPPVISSDNAGFLRNDASLAVVVISDATDQSTQPVSYYQNLLVNVKGFQRLSSFTFSTVTPTQPTSPFNCVYDQPDSNSARYQPIVNFTSGVAGEICNSNWAATLQNLGANAFGYRTQFYLTGTPDQTGSHQLVVKVNGVLVPPGPSTWQYDAASNSIKFNTAAVPQPGVPLTIEYTQTCF